MAERRTGISPEMIVHPGEILSDILAERRISQAELAKRTGVTDSFVSSLLSGKKSISASYAKALDYALDVPMSFWLNSQAIYDADMQTLEEAQSITNEERTSYDNLHEIVAWLQKRELLPKKQPKDAKILKVRSLLHVSNLSQLSSLVPCGQFRMSEKNRLDPLILGAWLQLCQYTYQVPPLDSTFSPEALPSIIAEAKSLMRSEENPQERLPAILLKYGIVLSIVKNFRGAPVQGYIVALDEGQYHMFLTLRGAWADIFWFSFFHELAHIIGGDVEKSSRFMDFSDSSNERERKANQRAADMLLDAAAYKNFVKAKAFDIDVISAFAASQGVPPYIVIGRLQRDTVIPYSWFTECKLRYSWRVD